MMTRSLWTARVGHLDHAYFFMVKLMPIQRVTHSRRQRVRNFTTLPVTNIDEAEISLPKRHVLSRTGTFCTDLRDFDVTRGDPTPWSGCIPAGMEIHAIVAAKNNHS